ncbi:transferase family protein [Sarocladium implicatum]|nr:transferase family protein [Sarocladium implicatum]
MATLLNLGPLGHHFEARTYTILTLGFTTINDAAQKRAIQSLSTAADKLVEVIPWLAGQVVIEGLTNDDSGTYRVLEYLPHDGPGKFLRVKDCRDIPGMQTYQEILSRRAPLSILHGETFSPCVGFPNIYPPDQPMPVVIVQANLLHGGIFLTFCGQHNVLDGNANARFIHHFAKICSGHALHPDQVAAANSGRPTAVPASASDEAFDPLTHFRRPSMLGDSPPSWPPGYGKSRWHCFHLSASSVADLKSIAKTGRKTTPSLDAGAPYVSTNDVLTAFIWRHVMRIRHLEDNTAKTNCVRAINGRARFDPPISQDHIDHVITCLYTGLSVEDLLSLPLYSVAEKLRKTLLEGATPHHFQSYVHLLQTTKDRSTISYGASMTANDMMITSFTSQGIYDVDFGTDSGLGNAEPELQGYPDIVRRPDIPGGDGIVYILPQARDGSIDFTLHIDDDAVAALGEGAGHEEWTRWVDYIG